MDEKKEYAEGMVCISAREYRDLVAGLTEAEKEASAARIKSYDAGRRVEELEKEVDELKKELKASKNRDEINIDALIAMIRGGEK